MKRAMLISILCFAIDQIIKITLTSLMEINTSTTVIKNFFKITLVENDGAAFSTLKSKTLFLIIISLIVLIGLIMYIKKTKLEKREYIIYGILIGGVCGNLLDRIIHSSVIDYLDFNILGYPFPIFNFADICIVISMLLIVITSFKGDKHESKIRNKTR